MPDDSDLTDLRHGWWREFVAGLPAHTAKLALVSATGAPLVAPVWVTFDGDDLVFNTGTDTAKARAIRRDPRVALCFDDERPPFSFVIVHGTATITSEHDEVARWATEIGGRYMGADRAVEYGTRNSHADEVLVRVTPTRVLCGRDVSD